MKAYYCVLLMTALAFLAPAGAGAQGSGGIEMRVKTLLVDPESQAPVVILESAAEKKLLPIWINVAEARAIALELENVTPPRPMTHDLIRNLLKAMGANLQRMTITELRNSTYYGALTLSVKGQKIEIDCRPSDGIAIALRMKAPIFASTQVLTHAKTPPTERLVGREQIQNKLGIQAQDLTAELANLLDSQQQKGVLVTDVKLGSAAMKSGLQRGDIIIKIDSRAILSAADLEAALQSAKLPGKVTLEVIKKGKPATIIIEILS